MAEEGTSGEILCPPNSCPVCLSVLADHQLGKPENCTHLFCLSCIFEWSKNVNTCPVDRVSFNNIDVLKPGGDQKTVLRKIYVPDRRFDDVLADPEGLTFCEVCNQCDREDLLLLCDGCDKGYHIYCLTPPLKHIPRGNWYCHVCHPIVFGQERTSSLSSFPTINMDDRGDDSSYHLSSSREDECTSTDEMMVIDHSSGEVSEEETIEDKSAIVIVSRSHHPRRINTSSSSENDSRVKNLTTVSDGPTKTQSIAADKCDSIYSSPSSSLSISSGSGSLTDAVGQKSNVGTMLLWKSQPAAQGDVDTSSNSPVINKGRKRPCKLESFSGTSSSVESLVSGGSEIEHVPGKIADLCFQHECRPNNQSNSPLETTSSSTSQNQLWQKTSTPVPVTEVKHKKKRRRRRRRKGGTKKEKLTNSATCSLSPHSTPPRRARTVATSGSSPWVDRSFREAVIASHKHQHSVDGLREAQKVLQEARQDSFCSPQKRFGNSLWSTKSPHCPSNLTLPCKHQNQALQKDQLQLSHGYTPGSTPHEPSVGSSISKPVFPDYRKELGDIASASHSTPSLYPSSSRISQPSNPHSSSIVRCLKFGKPKKLNLSSIGVQTTIDYVGQIQEKLEDLSSGQCVFNRDGSIIPIRDNSSLLVSATRWNRLDSKGLSRKDGSGQYLPRSVMSSTSSPVLKVTAKKRRRRRKKHLPNCTKPNCTRCLRARNHRLKISRDNERECSSATNQTIKLTSPIRDGNQNSNNSCMSVEGSDNLGYSQAKVGNPEATLQLSQRTTTFGSIHCSSSSANLSHDETPSSLLGEPPSSLLGEYPNIMTGFPFHGYDPYLDVCKKSQTEFDTSFHHSLQSKQTCLKYLSCLDIQPQYTNQSSHGNEPHSDTLSSHSKNQPLQVNPPHYENHQSLFSANEVCDLQANFKNKAVQRLFSSSNGSTSEGSPDRGTLQPISSHGNLPVSVPDCYYPIKQEPGVDSYSDEMKMGLNSSCHHKAVSSSDAAVHVFSLYGTGDNTNVFNDVKHSPSSTNAKTSQHTRTPLFETELGILTKASSSHASLITDSHYIAPATGQSVATSSLPPLLAPRPVHPPSCQLGLLSPSCLFPVPSLMPLDQTTTDTVTAEPPSPLSVDRSSGQSVLSINSNTITEESTSSNMAPSTSLTCSKQPILKPLSMCMLNSEQAVTAVKRHLELHYIAGNITADVLENIKKRAIKKVQLAKKLVPLERVRKLVDEYVILHKQYTETKKDTV